MMQASWFEFRSVVEHGKLIEKPVLVMGDIGATRSSTALCPDCFNAVRSVFELTEVVNNKATWTRQTPFHICTP